MRNIHKALCSVSTVFCMLMLIAIPAFAPALADDSVYKIEGIAVDVTAENAVEAREKAFEEAQVKAFEALTEKLMTAFERETFEMPDVDTISSFVQDFEVTNEQLSAVRYKGTYTFRFRPGSVQGHMSDKEFSYSDAPANPVLILPYSQIGTRTVLWDNNPFMQAWAKMGAAQREAKSSTLIPLGDLLDVTQAKDDPALRYDKMLLDTMVRRYEATEAVILIADKKLDQSLSVSMYSTQSAIPSFIKVIDIVSKPGLPENTLYEDAVREVQAALRQDWKKKTEIDPTQLATLKARARFETVQEWIRLKRAVEGVSGVSAVKVQGLKPKEAIIRIEYLGGEQRLIPAFSQAGIALNAPYQANQYNAQLQGDKIYDIRLGTTGRY